MKIRRGTVPLSRQKTGRSGGKVDNLTFPLAAELVRVGRKNPQYLLHEICFTIRIDTLQVCRKLFLIGNRDYCTSRSVFFFTLVSEFFPPSLLSLIFILDATMTLRKRVGGRTR